jgi:hypothetical protein
MRREQELAAREVPEPSGGPRGINLAGVVTHGVAFGVMAPGSISDVGILEAAFGLAVASAGHVREAELIADRLVELGAGH